METLVDLLRESAERYAERDALLFKPGFRVQRWSYGELWKQSGNIAAALREQGISKGDRVIIWSPNRPEWALALFGCLRAGAAAVPLDVRSTPDFVQQVVKSTDAVLAFASGQALEVVRDIGVRSIDIQEVGRLEATSSRGVPEVGLTGEDLAEIMFTSGTTGDPKGVMLTHRNVLSNVQSAQEIVPTPPPHRLLSLLPLSHMLEQSGGLFAPVMTGSAVVYPASRQPGILLKTIQEMKITMMLVVPQALQLFMNAIEREVRAAGKEELWSRLLKLAAHLPMPARRQVFRSVHARFGGRLRYIGCGGAYLDPALGQKWESMGFMVLQGYGATEASPFITSNTHRHRRLDSLGKALPGQEVKIAPDGEILARGLNITPGYWKNPQATSAIFEDGWYKTGDLGYMDNQGFLYFKGRKKDLIVLANGQNVYPDDIENLLRKQPGVVDATVVGLPRDGSDVEVRAVLLLQDGVGPGEVVRSANSQLAAHQQIGGYSIWPEEDFPRTHTLKVKKNLVLERLTAGNAQHSFNGAPTPAPAPVALTDLQRVLAGLASVPASELTPEKQLGYELQLDSLGRVELLSALEQELGVYIDDSQVGPETTIGELESLISTSSAGPKMHFPSWGRSPWCRVVRPLLQYLLVFPAFRLFYEVKTEGRENLASLTGPVIFAANHNVKLDIPSIFVSLPFGWLQKLCPAAAADDIFGSRIWRIAAPLLGNAFPFSREGAVRPSLEHMGRLMDAGWSILIFPEGYHSRGEIKPFKAGAGLIATESRSPIVPVRVKIEKGGVFEGARFPVRGRIEVNIGRPLFFASGTSPLEATDRLFQAVRGL